jgi:hypothetical protein
MHLDKLGFVEAWVVAHQWLVRGTNTGPGADGSKPTGRTITLQGASNHSG